jgi:hypothetical protein
MTHRHRVYAACGIALCLSIARPPAAHAVPAFAGQTGQPCTACHVGAFGPELTPFGRAFKIGGYTLQGGTGTLAHLPLAAFVQTSFTTTSKSQGEPAAPHFAANNNAAIDQVSLFLAGRINDHAGAFVQATYDGIGHAFALDNTDIRLTTAATIDTHAAILGLSLNNGPMIQDPYNTTYAWNYPFFGSSLAPTPAASTILGGPLLGNTLGLTATAYIDDHIYAEAGAYDTQAPGLLARLGESYGPGNLTGPAPYVRLAYEWNWGANSAHLGGAFLHGRFDPATSAFSTDGGVGHDSFTDAYTDAGYQFISGNARHTVTLNGFYNHENRTLDGTAALGGASTAGGTLNETRLTGTYYFENTYGATLSWQRLWGSADPLLFQQGTPLGGSANGKPDSNAFILEANWVPFGKEGSWLAPLANMKLGVQYTIYTMFNGGAHNYDGFGRNASDNDTLFLTAWWIL